jgi:hypothetical protein
MTCGDEFIETTYIDGHRTSDGSEIVRSWRHCPRADDLRPPSFLDRYQEGRCHGPRPFACAIQRAAYRDHRPSWRACRHASSSEFGESCWAKDGTPITLDGRVVAAA